MISASTHWGRQIVDFQRSIDSSSLPCDFKKIAWALIFEDSPDYASGSRHLVTMKESRLSEALVEYAVCMPRLRRLTIPISVSCGRSALAAGHWPRKRRPIDIKLVGIPAICLMP